MSIQLGFTYKNDAADDSAVANDLQTETMECIFQGIENSGKTSLVKRLNSEADIMDDLVPTKGYSFRFIDYKDFNYRLWDVGGNKNSIDAYWNDLIEKKHGLVWVIDSVDQTNLELSRQELLKLLDNKPESLKSLQILCNKQDQPEHDRMTLEYIENYLNLIVLDYSENELSWKIKGCSAVDDFGIYENMIWLIDDMKQKTEYN